MPRVRLLASSPRLPAGLLSWPAWQAVTTSPVLTGDPAHRQLAALAAAGVEVAVLDGGLDAAGLAEQLRAQAAVAGTVVWLSSGEADAPMVRELGRVAASSGVEVEVLHGSHDLPGAGLLDVVAVMDRLRSPGGCPWDAEQTHRSLAPYLLEEAYEAYEALETGDHGALREELGDVLLQVVFHARVASEAEGWDVDEVAAGLVAKLVRRHPHVFAGAEVAGPEEVARNWDRIKAAEKGRTSVTEGVPLGQPALALAAKLQRRAGRLGPVAGGFDPTGPGAVLWRAVEELRAAGEDDPEAALRAVARSYRDHLVRAEARLSDGEGPRR